MWPTPGPSPQQQQTYYAPTSGMNGMAAPASSGGLQQQQQQAAPPPASSLGLSFVSAEANSGGSKAARKKAAKGALPTWQCALCTFNNKITREACEMCEMPNPRANDPPAPVPAAASKQPNGLQTPAGVVGAVKKGSTAASVAAAAAAAPAPLPAAPVLSSVSSSFRTLSYENGLITACNNVTYDEVMRRRLIGLPRPMMELVSKMRAKHSAIFLLNMETRELFGVFEAEGQPGLDLEPDAWAGQQSYNGRRSSRFPAQCHFSIAADFDTPLAERHYRDLLFREKRDKIRLLSAEEVKQLIKLFQAKSKLRKVPAPPQPQAAAAPVAAAAAVPAAAAAPAHTAAPPAAAAAAPATGSSASTSRRNSIDSSTSGTDDNSKKSAAVAAAAAAAAAAVAGGASTITVTTSQGGITKKVTKAAQTCKRWLADECTFTADECKFLHVATVCRAFQRGTCPKGKNCPFVHDKVDREHYRHGRSYCQKTAVHADAPSAASAAAAAASAAKAKAAAPKDSLDSILSGLGGWKNAGKKVEPAADHHAAAAAAAVVDEDDDHTSAAATQDDLDDAAAVAELDAAQQAADEAADDELLLAQQAAMQQHQQQHHPQHLSGVDDDDDAGLGFDPMGAAAGMAFEHHHHQLHHAHHPHAGAPGAAGLFMPDAHGFEQHSAAQAAQAGNGGVSGWGQFDGSVGFADHSQQQVPPGPQSLLSQGPEGSMFFGGGVGGGGGPGGGVDAGDEEQFAWFNTFRTHVVAPALQAQHQREQQAQQRIIGPD